jgi:hypothetical protein
MRFDSTLKQYGLKVQEMLLQPTTKQLYFTFMNSNKIMFMAYNGLNIVGSIFTQSASDIVKNNLYTVV